MLRKIPASIPLRSGNHFYDPITHSLFYLRQGKIIYRALANEEEKQILMRPSSGDKSNYEKIIPKLVVISGSVIMNTAKNLVTNELNTQSILHGSLPLTNGSVWQFHAPLSLNNLKFGLVKINQQEPPEYSLFQFNSSTARTITFELQNQELKIWVNGVKPNKNHSQKINYDIEHQRVYPCVKIQGKGNTVVFSPIAHFNIKKNSNIYNPFAVTTESVPSKLIPEQIKGDFPEIASLHQLNNNKALIIWKNQQAKLVHRNNHNNSFSFPLVTVQGSNIINLFSKQQYELISQITNEIFDFSLIYNIKNIYQWIKYLLRELDTQNSNNTALYELLLTKLCILRPYLHAIGIKIPNLIISSQIDLQNYHLTQGYFPKLNNAFSISSNLIYNHTNNFQIEGQIIQIAQNYLITQKQTTVIIYHLNFQINQVFRHNFNNKYKFIKSNIIENYEEKDLRLLRNEEGSYLYKILSSCLQKEKKCTGDHLINENDIKQLVDDYNITESEARLALEQTGDVQEALVWLSGENKALRLLEIQSQKNIDKINNRIIRILQLNKPFSRLLLQIDNKIYLLGLAPNQIKQFVYKSDKQYVNLENFKLESELTNLDFSSWYVNNHAVLHIQDEIELQQSPKIIGYASKDVYVIDQNQTVKLTINEDLLFDRQSCISQQNVGAADIQNFTTKSVNGQLVSEQKINKQAFEPHTIVIYNQQLYTNVDIKSHQNYLFDIQISNLNFQIPAKNSILPLIVERGPPGCNLNYQICNILDPKGTFLANYPHEIKLRHLHSKYLNVANLTLQRNRHKKNANQILEGYIYFQNDKRISKKRYFSFKQNEDKIVVEIDEKQYWRYIIISPKYSQNKKLPYEFGAIHVSGKSISSLVYHRKLYKNISDSLNIQPSTFYNIISVKEITQNKLQVEIQLAEPNTITISPTKQTVTLGQLQTIAREPNNSTQFLNIDKLSPEEFNAAFLPKSEIQEHILREVSKSDSFSFAGFRNEQIRKFIDVALYAVESHKNDDHSICLIQKLWKQNSFAQKYLLQLADQLLDNKYTIPLQFLAPLIKRLSDQKQIMIIKNCLEQVSKYRSAKYGYIKALKKPYLLLQTQFYSSFYFSQIEELKQNLLDDLFEQDAIQSQIIQFKGQLTRRYLLKLPSVYQITNLLLRFDRSEISSKLIYRVFRITKTEKIQVAQGRIFQQQWIQLTKYPHKQSIEQLFTNQIASLNAFGVILQSSFKTQYLQIQIIHTQTGIVSHSSQSESVPQIDIIPQVYGYKVQSSSPIDSIDQNLDFKEDQMFFISNCSVGRITLQKYSVSKNNQTQSNYYKPLKQDVASLQSKLRQKVQSEDYESIPILQKRFFIAKPTYTKNVCLDYIYTLLTLTLNELDQRQIKLEDSLCESLFESIIKQCEGPIKMSAFKALSHKVSYLMKSLQYLNNFMPNLKNISLTQKSLYDILDFQNIDLCRSLNRLVIEGLDYQDKWGEFLIKLSSRIDNHKQLIEYIIHNDWLGNKTILDYFTNLPEDLFANNFLKNLKPSQLSRYIIECKKNKIKTNVDLLIDILINASEEKTVDLDIVSLMFEQSQIKWSNLYRVIKSCPEASDTIINHFLNAEHPHIVANNHFDLLAIAAQSQKYSQLFAVFLGKIYQNNRQIFKSIIVSLTGVCKQLHYDFYETVSNFLIEECNVGGVEGAKILSESSLFSLHAAGQIFKIIQKLPEGTQIPNQDLYIEWALSNNTYELSSVNPANKSPGYHLIRTLSENVNDLLKSSTVQKLLVKYSELKNRYKQNKKISLSTKHILINQLHEGVSYLLKHTIIPGSLANVLAGDLLSTIINELKESLLKNVTQKKQKWTQVKQVDYTEQFKISGIPEENIKDILGGRQGTKTPITKIPISSKKLTLTTANSIKIHKFIVGFSLDEKATVLPNRIDLFGGQNQAYLDKIGQLILIQDQQYIPFGVRVFGLNFNNLKMIQTNNPSLKILQLRLQEPLLTSVSDILENPQRSKKNASYNLSFLSINGYESQPTQQPDYTKLYITLLSFLSQSKYRQDLRKIIKTDQFDQKLQLIIQVLNDLLPNQEIQNLMIALNEEGQSVLEHILRSKNANSKLIKVLLLSKLTKQNLSRVISYALNNFNQQYADIIINCIRIASYAEPQKTHHKTISDISNINQLLEQYQNSKNENKKYYYKVIASLLTVPNLYHYQIGKIVNNIWTKQNRTLFYPILASVIVYYPIELQSFAKSGKTLEIVEQLLVILKKNQSSKLPTEDCFNHIYLLNSLATVSNHKQLLISNNTPIKIVNELRHQHSLIQKYSADTMKHFISFFQNTCIQSSCQEQFADILITLMNSLNDVESSHHQFFIHQFFFPLINAYNGVPVTFVWKGLKQSQYLSEVTEILLQRPIRSNNKEILYENEYYSQIDFIDTLRINSQLIICSKQPNQTVFKLSQKKLVNIKQKKSTRFQIIDKKISIQLQTNNYISVPNQNYIVYQIKNSPVEYLTNQTLINLKNPSIFEEKYLSRLPITTSTYERIYFLPAEMSITDIIKHINISGYRLEVEDIESIKPKQYETQKIIQPTTKLCDIAKHQNVSLVKFQIQAEKIFASATIQKIATTVNRAVPIFIPQETIFKSFEKKKGLEKLIKVLIGCVKNWQNQNQSKIWLQYLKQLESYSCFPVFSSIYMNKQDNVTLLFDLLLGLPEKQDSKKWLAKQKESVKFLYDIIKDVFAVEGQQSIKIRAYAIESGFYATMLQRLHLVTKQPKRFKQVTEEPEEEQILPQLQKNNSQDQYKNKLQKRKGVGYGTDSSTNQKWDLTGQQEARKQQSDQILGLLKILQSFLGHKNFIPPQSIVDQTYESALLPILESSLRGGSLLQISKSAQLFQGQLSFIKIITKNKKLVPVLMPVPKIYEPKQPQSIHSLLKTLANTSKIFLSCLTGSASEKVSEQIAKSISQTFELVEEAVSEYQISFNDEQEDKKILQLPLAKKYPLLLKDLRFDYIDMKDKSNKITKHHYASYYQPNHKSPAQKTIRLAQELADVSHALPIDHTNAIFVRCDKQRVDFMQALIMGSNGTPYGHGAYLFDIHFEDNYPNNPPKVNLTTTGSGQIRFNPNLYACGKVCLSLLGTWRGSAMQNWDAKVSTLLQVLVSIQSIIMSQDIYFNEPGFEHEQGTVEGQKKNEAYANIVRYGNIKFAMTQNIKNPPKGFETIIRRHFFLKKQQILEQCAKWLKIAEKRQASYTGLVSDHNHNWCNTFKKSKTEYKTMLEKAIKELEIELNKLPEPTSKDLVQQKSPKKVKKVKIEPTNSLKEDHINEEIDVTYDKTNKSNYKELDINDEKVKDRWSRYIGAMGIQAVSKQSKANVLLFGLGAVGVQIAKNIILSGCRQFSICDSKVATWQELAGQFYLSEEDIGKSRIESCLYKLQELNHYVKVNQFTCSFDNLQTLKKYNLVILTEQSYENQIKINEYCRQNGIKFMIVDCYGLTGQIFNDFGEQFEIVDKNGEETVEVMIQNITNDQNGIVTLVKGQRHPYQDGEAVRISGVNGMIKGNDSINGTIHKIKVINQSSFSIGNTSEYSLYEGNGTARNMKLPIKINFKSFIDSLTTKRIDSNLQYYDFTKCNNNSLLHQWFTAISQFRDTKNRLPQLWKVQEAKIVSNLVKKLKGGDLSDQQLKTIYLLTCTSDATFGPICAFYGGLAAQEAFKAITGKYTPVNQFFYTEFTQLLPTLNANNITELQEQINNLHYQPENNRLQSLNWLLGKELTKQVRDAKIFLIGSGAIGCQLLKNYAMINLATGLGEIIVTDPDHIETSNLNRQFLFRQKHLRKPKSMTATAATIQMNPLLKGKIKARLDRVSQNTRDVFSNQFWKSLTIVTNALDNVQARQYVDQRCVENKIPLLESGTLSSKGHVQVILPYLTETYGSKNDPAEDGEIPHCTLKMFPQQTLHCVQWARDIFGKDFTLKPKALTKLIESYENYIPTQSDLEMLKDCLKMVQNKPANFQDAIYTATLNFYQYYRNDILQLLYTYPLDAKTKDGKPFWKLPKRPPTPILQIEPTNELHNTFITSYAVLLCKIYNTPFPKDFRSQQKRIQIAKEAAKIKVDPFVPSDKLAQQMSSEVNNEQKQSEQNSQVNIEPTHNQNNLFTQIKQILNSFKENSEQLKIIAQQFEKDQDQNGHIDLIYSMANLRANNYKLDRMDWITTKIKAGRITPALSTTTSCIAALQTIQLIKYIKKCKLSQMRNTFINLAVPLVQFSEPGEVQKIKIHQKLTTNLWQAWSVGPLSKQKLTLKTVIEAIEAKYQITVKILTLQEGGEQIFSELVLGLESKKAQKQKLLNSELVSLLGEEDLSSSIDFTLVFAVNDVIAKHVPTLRLQIS